MKEIIQKGGEEGKEKAKKRGEGGQNRTKATVNWTKELFYHWGDKVVRGRCAEKTRKGVQEHNLPETGVNTKGKGKKRGKVPGLEEKFGPSAVYLPRRRAIKKLKEGRGQVHKGGRKGGEKGRHGAPPTHKRGYPDLD